MTVFSKFGNIKAVRQGLRESERLWPPPVPFVSKEKHKKKKSKDDSDDDDDEDNSSTKSRSFDIPMNPLDDKDTETYRVKVKTFSEGSAEAWILWRQELDDLIDKMGDDVNAAKSRNIVSSLLTGAAKEEYTDAINIRTDANDQIKKVNDQLTENDVLLLALNDVAKAPFGREGDWQYAYRYQQSYLRKNLFMGDMDPDKFSDRLIKLNRMLAFFPFMDDDLPIEREPLDDDELIDIFDSSKKIEWHVTMMSQGKRPHTFLTMKDARAYFKQLYNADQYKLKFSNKKHGGESTSTSSTKTSTKRRRNNDGSNHEKRTSSAKLCRLCKKGGHEAADCWTAEKNKSKRPKGYKNHRKSDERTYTRAETSALITKAEAQETCCLV